jgi:hypothetical protein
MKFFRLILIAAMTLISTSATPGRDELSTSITNDASMPPGPNPATVANFPVDANLPAGETLPPDVILTTDANNHLHITFPRPQGRYSVESDTTPPTVTWITRFNTEVDTKFQNLEADIADAESGLCVVEISLNNGQNWTEAWNANSFPWREPLTQTTWSYSDDFSAFSDGAHVVLLRARDCVGNVSPGEILVVRVKK